MKLEQHALRDGMVSIICFYLFWKIMFKVSLFELRMKRDINQFFDFPKIIITYFEDPYHTKHSQLARERREIWVDENCPV